MKHFADDIRLDKNYKRGSRGKKVRLLQEWLCLHNIYVSIDGIFGPATDCAIRYFQEKEGLTADGIVGENTFAALIRPMTDVLRSIPCGNESLGQMVVSYARQHLSQNPREVGGQNRGPWVRLYLGGREGLQWPWCAGFVCFVLEQACESMHAPLPIRTSFSCDSLADNAIENGIFLKEPEDSEKGRITLGSFFLIRKSPADWVHTGIIIKAEREIFYTIEGNSNIQGTYEGHEVCRRIRGYKNTDFILI